MLMFVLFMFSPTWLFLGGKVDRLTSKGWFFHSFGFSWVMERRLRKLKMLSTLDSDDPRQSEMKVQHEILMLEDLELDCVVDNSFLYDGAVKHATIL